MKESHKATRKILEAISELSAVVRELDPGSTHAYERIAMALGDARSHLTRAEAFES